MKDATTAADSADFDGDLEESDELYEHHRIRVDRGQELLRLDKFLLNRLPNASRTKIQAATHAGSVQVNGAQVKPNYRIKPGDLITITLPEPPREDPRPWHNPNHFPA